MVYKLKNSLLHAVAAIEKHEVCAPTHLIYQQVCAVLNSNRAWYVDNANDWW